MTLKTIVVLERKIAAGEKQWPQVLAILTASLAGVSMGLLFTWPSPSIPLLISPSAHLHRLTLAQASYLTVLPPLAVVIASPVMAILTDRLGRKPCLLWFTAGPQLIAWLLIAVLPTLEGLYLSRLLAGIADSCVFAVLPMYIGEVATPHVRGSWGNALTVSILLGQCIVNVIGAYTTILTTACILGCLPLLFLATFIQMPESPYYLLMRDRKAEARLSLQWLRGMADVEVELDRLTGDVARQLSEPGRIRDLFVIRSNRKALGIGAVARLCQQYCGISAFATYTKYMFDVAGGGVDSNVSSIVFAASLVVFSFISSAVLDRIGRRKAMIVSSLCGCLCLASLSTYLYLKMHSSYDLTSISWFPIVGMLAFVTSISAGLTIVPNMLLGEMFSSSIKGKALCLMNICFAVCIATSTKLFQVLTSTYGLYVPFAFHAACCVASAAISYYVIPDTTGKTLEEIQQDFKRDDQGKADTKIESRDVVTESYKPDTTHY